MAPPSWGSRVASQFDDDDISLRVAEGPEKREEGLEMDHHNGWFLSYSIAGVAV